MGCCTWVGAIPDVCRLGEELTPVEKAVGVLVDEELEDAQRLEHLCYGDRLRSWGVQHGEEKAAGRPHCGLPVLIGSL